MSTKPQGTIQIGARDGVILVGKDQKVILAMPPEQAAMMACELIKQAALAVVKPALDKDSASRIINEKLTGDGESDNGSMSA